MPILRSTPARAATCLAALAVLAGAAGCGGDGERIPVKTEDVFDDPFRGVPHEQLPVVVRASTYLPRGLDTVLVTDFDQVRERLGEPALGLGGPGPYASEPASDVWARADAEAALLTGGLLAPQGDRLEREYGFGPDDVLWEATGSDDDGDLGDARVIALHRGVDPAALQRAVDDGVGALTGAEVVPGRRVVLAGAARPDPQDSWRETRAVVGAGTQRSPESVYLHAGCVPLEEALGPRADPRRVQRLRAHHDLDDYEPVEAFAVVFGDRVATARLGMADYGEPRGDIFARAELVDDWPHRTPGGAVGEAFGEAFGDPVVDPGTGRVGFPLRDPPAAAALTSHGVAPYAVCAEE